jgi:hypothetical protein
MRFFAWAFGWWLRRTNGSTKWTLISTAVLAVLFIGGGGALGAVVSWRKSIGWTRVVAFVTKAGQKPVPYHHSLTWSHIRYTLGGHLYRTVAALPWWNRNGRVLIWIRLPRIQIVNPTGFNGGYVIQGAFGGAIVLIAVFWFVFSRLEDKIVLYDDRPDVMKRRRIKDQWKEASKAAPETTADFIAVCLTHGYMKLTLKQAERYARCTKGVHEFQDRNFPGRQWVHLYELVPFMESDGDARMVIRTVLAWLQARGVVRRSINSYELVDMPEDAQT